MARCLRPGTTRAAYRVFAVTGTLNYIYSNNESLQVHFNTVRVRLGVKQGDLFVYAVATLLRIWNLRNQWCSTLGLGIS